jgi:hypothetical protein
MLAGPRGFCLCRSCWQRARTRCPGPPRPPTRASTATPTAASRWRASTASTRPRSSLPARRMPSPSPRPARTPRRASSCARRISAPTSSTIRRSAISRRGSNTAGEWRLARVSTLDSALTLLDDTFRSPAEWELEPSARDPRRYQLAHRQTGRYLTLTGLSADLREAAVITLYPHRGLRRVPGAVDRRDRHPGPEPGRTATSTASPSSTPT